MHLKRLTIAFIVLPLAYFYITKLPAVYFLFLLISVAAVAQNEFYSMYRVKGPLKYTGLVFGAVTILAFSPQFIFQPFDLVAVLFIVIACMRLFLKRSPESSL
ncbi:MAG: phosphatidate cytidylyltransferase, partial [Nitrospirota bacterium]